MTLLLLLRPHGAGGGAPAPPYSNPEPYAWSEAGDTPPELASELALSFVLCKSTGEPVEELLQLTTRQITQQLNLPVSVTITMNMDDASYGFALLEQQPRLKVYRAATMSELAADPLTVRELVFYGSLPSEGVREDAKTGLSTMSFQDPSWVLNHRYVQTTASFTNTDQGAILWSIINTQNARTNGDTWIREGATSTGVLRDRTYDAGKEVAGLIDDMTKVDQGCDVGVTPTDYWDVDGTRGMGLFNSYAEKGTAKPEVQFIYASTLTDGTVGGLPSNVGNLTRTRAKTITMATSVGSASSQFYQNTGSAFGLLEEFETYSDISIPQTLLDKSVGKVANRQNAPMILEITDPTIEAPQPFVDYNVGDTVYLSCRRGGMEFYDLSVRVQGIDITINQEGALSTKLTISTLPSDDLTGIIVTPDTGGGVPTGSPPPGDERISTPYSALGGTIDTSDSSVLYLGSDSISISMTGSGTTLADGAFEVGGLGSLNGLIVGDDYTLTAWTRGNSAAPGAPPISRKFYIFASNSGFFSGLDRSADANARIWNATQATRETWTQMSVTFTASNNTMGCGWVAQGGDAGVSTYTAAWQIVAA